MWRVTTLQRGTAVTGGAAYPTAAAATLRRSAAPSAAAAAAVRAAHSASAAAATTAHRCHHCPSHTPQRTTTRCFSSSSSPPSSTTASASAASAPSSAAGASAAQPQTEQSQTRPQHDDDATHSGAHEPFYDPSSFNPTVAAAATASAADASAAGAATTAASNARRAHAQQSPTVPISSVWSWGAGFLGGLGRDSYAPSPLPLPVEFSRIGALPPELQEELDAAARAAAAAAPTPEAAAAALASARPDHDDPAPQPAVVASNWGRNVMLSRGGSVYEWGWRAPFRLMLKIAGWNRWMPWFVAAMQRRRKGLRSLCGAEPLRAVRMPGWGVEAGDPAPPAPADPDAEPTEPLLAVAAACGSDYSVVLGSDGQAYAWGNNFYGQLGQSFHLTDAIMLTPQQICRYQNQHPNESVARHVESGQVVLPKSYPPTPIVGIAAGFAHTLLLTKAGQVYSCGKSDTGALGITHIYRDSKRVFFPHLIPVTDAFAAGEHGAGEIALKVRADDLGESALTPTQLAQNDPTIVDNYIGPVAAVAAGMKHSLFLTETGALYACGSNGLNELGNSTFHPAHGLVPVHLPLLHAPPTRSRVSSRRRKLYTSGPAGTGAAAVEQQEEEDYSSFFTPSALGSLEERIVKISAGAHHSLALSNLGNVYAWGLNQQGQCGVPIAPEKKWSGLWFRNVVSKKARPPTLAEVREREDAERGGPAPPDAIAPFRAASLENLAPVNTERAAQVKGITVPPTRILLAERAHEMGLTPHAMGQVIDVMAGFHDSVLLTDRGYCIMFGGGLTAVRAHDPYVFRLDQPIPDTDSDAGVSDEQRQVAERARQEWAKHYRVKQVAFGLGHAIAVVHSVPGTAHGRAKPKAAATNAAQQQQQQQ